MELEFLKYEFVNSLPPFDVGVLAKVRHSVSGNIFYMLIERIKDVDAIWKNSVNGEKLHHQLEVIEYSYLPKIEK